MFKLFKNNFKTTNDCIILATPLIIFLSILGWYFNYALETADNIPKLILAGTTLLVMGCGFLSAWMYMTKKTLQLANQVFIFDKDRARAFRELIMSLPRGIGKLFLPFVGITILLIAIYSLAITGATFIIVKFIGTIDINNLFISKDLLVSSQELFNELLELPQNEIIVINCWYLLVSAITAIISFLTMFLVPEIVYSEKNPLKAIIQSLKKIVITFPKSLLLFLYIYFLLITSAILNTILMFNPILYFFVLVIHYYLIIYIVVLLFTYYEQTFIKSNKEN